MTTDTRIEWVDEPPSAPARAPGRMQAFVLILKENPGRWAKYPSGNSGAASALKKRYGCEAVTRRTPTGVDVYVRHLGGAA